MDRSVLLYSPRVLAADIEVVAKRATKLGLCVPGWFDGASITIGYPGAKASKGGATAAGKPKLSLAQPPRSFFTRAEVQDFHKKALEYRRPVKAADFRRMLAKMDVADAPFFRAEYPSICLDPEIGEGVFCKDTLRYAYGALIAHEMAHVVCVHSHALAASTLGLEHLGPAERGGHQKLWQEVYRLLRGDFAKLLDRHYGK